MWGPIVYGPGSFTRRESTGPSRRGLWPKPNNVKYRIALRYRRGLLSPRQTQSPTEERGKNGIGLSLKENLKISGEGCPYYHSMLCTRQSRTLWLLQPPPTTLGMSCGTSISLENFDPTRGRRTANTGQYKRENK